MSLNKAVKISKDTINENPSDLIKNMIRLGIKTAEKGLTINSIDGPFLSDDLWVFILNFNPPEQSKND